MSKRRTHILHLHMLTAYGLTETSPATHINPVIGFKIHTVGIAVPNTQYKVI